MSMRSSSRRTPQQPQRRAPEPPRKTQPPRRTGRGILDVLIVVVLVVLAIFLVKYFADTTTTGADAATTKPAKTSTASATGKAASGSQPVITEVMSANRGTVTTADGEYTDWIELYNPTDKTMSLTGYSLSDNIKKPTKFVFPATTLGPGEFVLVFCTGEDSTKSGEYHASFKLGSEGEEIILTDADGNEVQRLKFGALTPNDSYACAMDALTTWAQTDKPTPGYSNDEKGRELYEKSRRVKDSTVIVNEVMPSNSIVYQDEDGEYCDWVEIYNSSDETVSLEGYGLSNKEEEPKRWEFPKVTIKAHDYVLVYLSGKNRRVADKPLHADFRLNSYSDTILLSNKLGQIVSEVAIKKLDDDTSYGLIPDTEKWQAFTHPTPGKPNTEDGYNDLQSELYSTSLKGLVISEVMSSNSDTLQDDFDEYPGWIELQNRSDKTIDLKGYGLTDKSDELGRWEFPDITLDAGEYMTLYASGRNLTDDDAVSKKKLHTDFTLKATGGVLVLTNPDGQIVDHCLLPALRADLTYARQANNATFEYVTKPTPGAANKSGYPGITPNPIFSLKAGIYTSNQTLELSSADGQSTIHYTLDATVPNSQDKTYTDGLELTGDTVVRATAYREGYLPSNTVSATYLIGEDIKLPIVSIVTDPDNLFDEETGIYAKGSGWTEAFPHFGANFWQDWERPAHVEVIEPDGTVGISQDAGIKIYGQFSRGNDQKSFALIARGEYGNGSFDYKLFPDLPYTEYESFIVRNSAQDANMSRIRTALQLDLARETSEADMQSTRQGIVFVNGEFWGCYDIMEKINEHFLAQHHNVDPDQVDLLEGNGKAKFGSNEEYNELIEYVKNHDLSKQEYYDYVADRVDIDNYIDWACLEIYTVNSDLGNVRFWKPRTEGGKWRWILYDLDWGFFFSTQEKYTSYQDTFSKFLNPKGNGVGNMFSNTLIRGLLKNEKFKEKFIKRFVYHCTVTFETERVLAKIDELTNNIEPYMARDKEKWDNGTVERWKSVQIELLKTFAKVRPEMNLNSMQKYFDLSDAEMDKLLGK